MSIAKQLSNSLADRLVIAKVDGNLWDVMRPLEGDVAVLELLDFDSNAEARAVFWHSSAHVLGEACEQGLACHVCIGPPLDEGGFYYEIYIPNEGEKKLESVLAGKPGRPVTPADYPMINELCMSITKEKQPFERLELPKQVLLEMFSDNPFKVHLIKEKIPDGTTTTVYRCGPLIDLCRGPHVPHTGRIRAIQTTKNSSSYFLGDAKYAALQRVYGISFPEPAQLKAYLADLAEADKRDHRKIGRDQQLFFFHEWSPGSAFFLPHGTRIYNRLQEFLRGEYIRRGFSEVHTPNLFNVELWRKSGHWENYRENMFAFTESNTQPVPSSSDPMDAHNHAAAAACNGDVTTFALKPMNCPGHCLMFDHRERSYRELPLRLADFGVLHRNELSGALGGLTRVRRFQQDDAHIFCRADQIEEEISNCIGFMRDVYGIMGYKFNLVLSTRPEKYMGEIAQWDAAESQLTAVLNASGFQWALNPGDGAFYGPKIDISIEDAHHRKHQCATIQLDFQLPIRFNLTYRSSDEKLERPVIIHRAILGSLERQFAILAEHFAGDWPFWLSPRQIAVIPVAPTNNAYAEQVSSAMQAAGFYADSDCSGNTLNKKIRNAELAPYKFIIVVGNKEASDGSVNIRKAKQNEAKAEGVDFVLSLEDAIAGFKALVANKSLSAYLA